MFKRNLSSKINLLRLISKLNSGQYIDPNLVDITNVRVFRGAETDTEASVAGKPTVKGIQPMTVRYRRKDIGTLLGESLKLDLGKQLYTAELLPEINRRYGFALEDSDIVVEKINISIPTSLVIKMRSDNPIWTGGLPIDVKAPAETMAKLLTISDLTLDDVDDGKLPADLLYYGDDFTEIRSVLISVRQGDSLDKSFRSALNACVDHKWVGYSTNRQFNLTGAGITYNGPTSGCPVMCNTDYSNVMVLALGDLCTNYAGNLVLHYN